MAGRPSKYSEKLAATICSRIADGESLSKICRDKDMPSRQSVFFWMQKHEGFSDNYARAYEQQAAKEFDEMEELAATATPETVQVVRLQLDARKWCLARKQPKKYGERISNDHTSSDGSMTPKEIPAKVAESIAKKLVE